MLAFMALGKDLSVEEISDPFLIFAPNIHLDCGCSLEPPYRGGYNEFPQFMFFSQNKEYNVNPGKPRFSLYKAIFSIVFSTRTC